MRPAFVALSALPALVAAQSTSSGGEGGPSSGPSSSPQAAGYSCDPNSCKLPSCLCASTSPPGGLAPADVPQFIVFTADDAVQSYTINAVNSFLAHRRNPNACTPRMSYFVSLQYTNFSMVTDWYVAGNEIADHTMTHVGDAPADEIQGNLKALNAFSGIPLASIQGFRAPFLNYSSDTLTQLHDAAFMYDSSMTSATPANETDTDAFWPYTLDNGAANDCLTVTDICQGKLKLPGLWEVPMYGIFDQNQGAGVHLMDPWLDSTDMNAVTSWMQSTFLTHYNGNRQPFGIYTHPIHLATGYPGLADPTDMINMLNSFLDWAQGYSNVWIVSNEQLLAWMQNPQPASALGGFAPLGCTTPSVTDAICNGMSPNENGLLVNCPFSDFPWTTCYGCPTDQPVPANPVPAQNTSLGVRYHLPANCSTAFFDPVKNVCTCDSSSCAFTDQTRPLGNYSQGGTGGNSSTGATATTTFKPFSAANPGPQIPFAGLAAWAGVSLVSLAAGAAMLR